MQAIRFPPPRESPFVVYFIRNTVTSAIKIGFATYPTWRLKQLQTATPDRLELVGAVAGSKSYEAELHRRFSRHRLGGEWFSKNDELDRFIEEVVAPVTSALRGRTVWDECQRKDGCRYGLKGIRVRVVGEGSKVQVIKHSFWGSEDRLFLKLYDGDQVAADQAILVDDWPVTCCSPAPLAVGKVMSRGKGH